MRKLKLLTQHGDCEYILIVAEAMHLLSTPKEGSKNMRKKKKKINRQSLKVCTVVLEVKKKEIVKQMTCNEGGEAVFEKHR